MLRLPFAAVARGQCVRSFARTPLSLNKENASKLPSWLAAEPSPEPAAPTTTTRIEDPMFDAFLSVEGTFQSEQAAKSQPPVAPDSYYNSSTPAAQRPKQISKHNHNLPTKGEWHLHVNASNNNTILTFTNQIGKPHVVVSGGLCGFKHVQRSTYEAGYQCAIRMFDKIRDILQKNPSMQLEVTFKGFGQGREAVFRALVASEGENIRDKVIRIKDTTPIKIGGTRAKKARRL